jgi:DNA-binding transcriptional LysR family regulator
VELRQLEYFATVAQQSSYRGAAAKLGMNESTLSIQIKHLEQELGVSLFERNRRGISVTWAGDMLLPRVERILAEVRAAHRELREARSTHSGRLSFGTTSSAPDVFGMLAAFVRSHPAIDLVFTQRHSEVLMQSLLLGELDYALVLLHQPTQHLPSGICMEPLLTRTFDLLVPLDHPLAAQQSVSIHVLETERIILHPAGSAPRAALESALATANITPHVVPFETNSPGTAVDLVEQGLGVAIGTATGHRNLRAVKIEETEITCIGALLWASGGVRTGATETFRRFACGWKWTPGD